MAQKDGVERDFELHQANNRKGKTGLVRFTHSPRSSKEDVHYETVKSLLRNQGLFTSLE